MLSSVARFLQYCNKRNTTTTCNITYHTLKLRWYSDTTITNCSVEHLEHVWHCTDQMLNPCLHFFTARAMHTVHVFLHLSVPHVVVLNFVFYKVSVKFCLRNHFCYNTRYNDTVSCIGGTVIKTNCYWNHLNIFRSIMETKHWVFFHTTVLRWFFSNSQKLIYCTLQQ